MISNGEKQRERSEVKFKGRIVKSQGQEAESEGQRWNYLAGKKTISIIKRNNFQPSW